MSTFHLLIIMELQESRKLNVETVPEVKRKGNSEITISPLKNLTVQKKIEGLIED